MEWGNQVTPLHCQYSYLRFGYPCALSLLLFTAFDYPFALSLLLFTSFGYPCACRDNAKG
jgi:hypothetical protein